MIYEEAIKLLNSVSIYHLDKYTTYAIDLAIEALDKQILKKPYDIVHCPLCKIEVELQPIDTEQVTYCLHCGQAIDWSEQSD